MSSIDNEAFGKKTVYNKKRHSIGLIAADLTDKYESEILKGILKKVKQADANLFCFIGGSIETQSQIEHPNFIQTWKNNLYDLVSLNNIDGLLSISDVICSYSSESEKMDFHKRFSHIPLVTIGEQIPGIPGMTVDENIGIRNIIAHLIKEHNSKRLAFIGYMEEIDYYNKRFHVFKKTLEDHNILFQKNLVVRGGFSREKIIKSLDALLDTGIKFDALVCVDDFMASHSMSYLSEKGMYIPSDVIITGFDDVAESKFLAPALTTVRQPLKKLGYYAVEKLLNILDKKDVADVETLPSELIVRRSCGCFYNRTDQHQIGKDEKRPPGLFITRIVTFFKSQSHEAMDESILSGWAEGLFCPFKNGIKDSSEKEFYKTVTILCKEILESDFDILAFKRIVSPFISMLISSYPAEKNVFYFDKIRGNAMEIIEEITVGASIKDRLKHENQAFALYNISQQLITACDNMAKLEDIVSAEFPQLGIQSFYLSTYCDNDKRDISELKISFGKKAVNIKNRDRIFVANQLIPGGIKNIPERIDFIILPLFYQNETLGTAVFEIGAVDGLLYETLASYLSSILKEVELIEKVQRYAADLKKEVAVRTKDIRMANEQLIKEIDEKEKIEYALQKEKDLAQITLESIGDGVLITDIHNKINYLNPVAEVLTGWTNQAVDGLDLQLVLDTEINLTEAIFKEPLEFCLNSKIGKKTDISLFAAYIPEKNGKYRGIIYIARDISKRKKAEKQAEYQLEQLIQAGKMASLGILISGVAHEINNPNNFIMMNAPVLLDVFESMIPALTSQEDLGKKAIFGGLELELLENQVPLLFKGIINGSSRINNIVNELKNYAQPNSFKKEDGLNINDIVQSAINLLSALIRQSTSHFKVDFCTDIPGIFGNKQKIEQVIINLLSNACQALTDKEQNITIRTTSQAETGDTVVEISDEGVGISPEVLDYITDPFFTTKRELGGMGLGLSISSKIVKDHDGKLIFTSIPGKGTKAVLLFRRESLYIKSDGAE